MRLALVLLLAACGAPPAQKSVVKPQPASPISERMESFTINGYLLAGAEYWPYVGTEDIKYPQEVLWGFYPVKGVIAAGETDPNLDSARPEAIECAQQSFTALQVFLSKNPEKLRRVVELGADQGYVPRFYLWTNDYGRAAEPYPPGMREARLWYWKRKQPEPPKPPGYWKWEASLTQAGVCQLPRPDQIESYLDEALATVQGHATK